MNTQNNAPTMSGAPNNASKDNAATDKLAPKTEQSQSKPDQDQTKVQPTPEPVSASKS